MRRLVLVLSLGTMLALASGCAPAPVEIELAFPSVDAARYGDRARLYAFPLASDEIGACPELLDDVVGMRAPSITPAYQSGLVRVCSFQGMEVPALVGPHAWLVEVRGTGVDILFAGCTVAEIIGGADTIRVELGPTASLDPDTLPMGMGDACIGTDAP